MKEYAIYVVPQFEQDLEQIVSWIEIDSPRNAANFLAAIEKAVGTLEFMPERCPKAPEAESFQENLRQLLCMNHRIVYRVKRDSVEVLTLRSCRQDYMSKEMLRKLITLR